MKNSKSKKIFFVVVFLFLLFSLAAWATGANIFFSVVLDRESLFEKARTGRLFSGAPAQSVFEATDENSWFQKNKEDLFLKSDDDLWLHGCFFENPKADGKFILVFHGYSGRAYQMRGYVKELFDMGYSVLAPDARAHGKSEGSIRGMGWLERKDALVWIDFLINRDSDCRIGLFGVSMGGATVMTTCGEELPKNVVAAVEDCGYSSVWDEFAYRLKDYHLPAFPLLNLSSLITKHRAGYGFKEASCIEQLKKATLPMLFIHGTEDDFVPFDMLEKVYSAKENGYKEKLVVQGAGHALSFSKDRKLYTKTVELFFQNGFKQNLT